MTGPAFTIRPVPMTYAGVRFRSTLEADWAATLDHIGITGWSYEPDAVSIDGTRYLPDFHIPEHHTWLEVKGPHDQRLHKTAAFHAALADTDQIIILRAPIRGIAVWEGIDGYAFLRDCPACSRRSFIVLPVGGHLNCRLCGKHAGMEHDYHSGNGNPPVLGYVPFARAPRPQPPLTRQTRLS